MPKTAKKTTKKLKYTSSVDVNKLNRCPECGSAKIVHVKEKAEVVCQECGAIFSKLTPEAEEKFEKVSDVI